MYILNWVPSKVVAKTPYELWTRKKPSIMHLHVWGCPAQARPYRPNEKKLDERTVSCYFVGYAECSQGFKFYNPTIRSFSETGNARFFEDVEFGGEYNVRSVVFEKEQKNNQDQVLIPDVVFYPNIALYNAQVILPNIVQDVIMVQDNNEVLSAQDNIDQVVLPDIVQDDASAQDNNEVLSQEPIVQTQQPQEMPLRRSIRERRSVILDDYIVFLQEREVDLNLAEDDLINLQQALQSSNSHKWIDAMKDEMKSMEDNGVWDLIEMPIGSKPIGCKWIFKTKRDSNGNVERYKARLVAKGSLNRKA